jgi:hypothetical protein
MDQALDSVTEAVDDPIEWPCATLVFLARDGDPPPMLAGIVPDPPAAVPLVPNHTAGTAFGTARATPLHRPAL